MILIRFIIMKIKDMKFKWKLILTYITVVLIPVLMVGFMLTNGMKNMVIDQAMKEANINTDRFQNRFSEMLRGIADVSDRLYINKDLHNILTREYKTPIEVVEAYSNFSVFNEFRRSYKEIGSIQIYSNNPQIIDNWEIRIANQEIINKSWYKKAVENNGAILWQFFKDEISGKNSLCLTRLIKTDVNTGVLVIVLNNNYIQSLLRDEPFETIVTLDKGTVVYSKDTSLIGKNTKDIGLKTIPAQSQNLIDELTYRNEPSKIITKAFRAAQSKNEFNIFTIIPLDAITKDSKAISIRGFEIMGTSFIISLFLLLIFSKMFSNKIIKLRSEMHKVVEGNFEIDTNITGRDEIGELHEDLIIMVKSIQRLIHEVYEERLHKEQLKNKQKEIELKMLASQINPHFLYNTLETIRMKAHVNGQDEISSIVKKLARIMRRNLEVTNKLVSLESELELVENYLEIQKFRFENRVNYLINIQTDIKDYMILPLLLQPIVENSIVHGLERKMGQGQIIITIEKNDGYLVILIEDNGLGMDEIKLKEVNECLENSTCDVKKSIGLKNVYDRIKLKYGDYYGLKIFSRPNEGTKVYLYLPIKGG